MNLQEFKRSLSLLHPPDGLNDLLLALWYDGQGDWDRAHDLADGPPGQNAAWVHAYLHRKEGDIWNADYWYRRAGKIRPDCSLEEEWEHLVLHFTE